MEVNGKIKFIGEIEEFGNFKKRELWLITDETYPQTLNIEFVQDKVHILNQYAVGDDVVIGLNLRGKVANTKAGERCFNSIQGWRISKVEEGDNPFV